MQLIKYIDDNFSGVISIRKNEQNIYQKAFGYADLPIDTPHS